MDQLVLANKVREEVAARVRALSEAELDDGLLQYGVAPVSELEFISACWIEEKETGRLVPFDLWEAQREIVPLLESHRLFALKARQLGVTWLDLAHWLYKTTFWGNRLVLVARQTLEDTYDAIHRLKVMHDSLPVEWQAKIVTDSVTHLGFANGSRFRALTATKRMGRSLAAYGALLDEFAFWEWQDEQLAAIEAGCARLHIVTTGNGPGDYAHKIWERAQAGESVWQPVFLPWHVHPERTQAWYEREVLGAIEPRLAKREYAATPEDAFAGPEGIFFERFDPVRNVADVQPVPNWPTVRAVDFGYHFPACLWIQTSPTGQSFVVAELVPRDRTTVEFAAEMRRVDAGLGLVFPPSRTYCDPAGNAANVQTAQSEMEILRNAGLSPVSKSSSIRDGCVRLMTALADPVIPLVVSRKCPWLCAALSNVRPDKHRPDLYDEMSDYCHVLDALRYWSVNRLVTPQQMPIRIAGGQGVAAGITRMRF